MYDTISLNNKSGDNRMASIGQTVIIRTDLFSLPEDIGLMAAQVAHIHAEIMRDILCSNRVDEDFISIKWKQEKDINSKEIQEWLDSPYLFVKKVPNAEGLDYFRKQAEVIKLPVRCWYDTVYVRFSKTMKLAFNNTLVGISIGPTDADKIRTVVGDLPLL